MNQPIPRAAAAAQPAHSTPASTPAVVNQTEPPITSIRTVLERSPFKASGEFEQRLAAARWATTGFGAAEVEGWVAARCFSPCSALAFKDAGLDPRDVSRLTGAGRGAYTDTVGFKVSRGDLSLLEALDVLGLLVRRGEAEAALGEVADEDAADAARAGWRQAA